MLKTYFKIAYRNLIKHKAYSIINISGLAIGMAASILILLWVQNELSYDKFHKNAGQIYRITADASGYDRTDLMSPLLATIPALALPEKRHHSHLSLIRPHTPICQSPSARQCTVMIKEISFALIIYAPRMIRESPSLSDHRHSRIAVRPMGNL